VTDSPTATSPVTFIPIPDDVRAFIDDIRFARSRRRMPMALRASGHRHTVAGDERPTARLADGADQPAA
jgi:hypothetical protein